MEDWTRVVLYGTYDGFVRSTVDPLQIAVRLDGGERVEIPSECVISADQIVKKDEIKLRDVIKRIKDLDVGAREVWLNEILNELGSDYGSAKYKDGYEQGKLEGEWVGQQLKDADKIRLELNKPVVPQFMADWIKYCKNTFLSGALVRSLIVDEVDFYNYANQEDFSKLKEFLATGNNQELFARAWLDGYTIEEKRYLVKVNAENCSTKYLVFGEITGSWFFAHDKYGNVIIKHTRKELEDAGFGWVFNCPGIEIEEVEE